MTKTLSDSSSDELSRIAHVLAVLDGRIERLSDDRDDPDYLLFHDVVRFLVAFPRTAYYPYLDALCDEVLASRHDLADTVKSLRQTRRSHDALGLKLCELLEAAQAGHLVPRDQLMEKSAAYAVTLRTQILPRYEELLNIAIQELSKPETERVRQSCHYADGSDTHAQEREEWDALYDEIFDTLKAQ
tara:strand:+ start:62 stop:622 length:561 start_codon:yes stop_codon:yes gene_type:complete